MTGINYNQAIYSGVSFPPRKDGHAGFFAISTDDDVIRESIHVILNTRKGEMPMNPDFGSSIHDLLFENITMNSQAILCQTVKEELERWEPRLRINSVSAYSRENERIIVVDAVIKLTNQSFKQEFSLTAA